MAKLCWQIATNTNTEADWRQNDQRTLPYRRPSPTAPLTRCFSLSLSVPMFLFRPPPFYPTGRLLLVAGGALTATAMLPDRLQSANYCVLTSLILFWLLYFIQSKSVTVFRHTIAKTWKQKKVFYFIFKTTKTLFSLLTTFANSISAK